MAQQFPWEALRVGIWVQGRAEPDLVRLAPVVEPPSRWPSQARLSGRHGDLALELRISFRSPSRFQFDLAVQNTGGEPVRLQEVRVLQLDAANGGQIRLPRPFAQWLFYQAGWQSWSDARVRKIAQLPPEQDRLTSPDMTIAGAPEGVVLLGFVELERDYTEIVLRLDEQRRFHSLQAVVHREGRALAPGATWQAPALLVAFDASAESLLDLYARQLAPEGNRLLAAATPAGWCSWYYYYGKNTEGDVHANIRALQDADGGQPSRYMDWILIDDGYQADIGDWLETNGERYPSGMKDLADRIKAAGKQPGIWLAPFTVTASSRVYREHPDWVLREGPDGPPKKILDNWGGPVYGLDLTHPDALAYVREVVRTMTQEWGYRLLKLDFMHHAAQPGERRDNELGRIAAYRQGLAAIREVVGPDVHLLGCGAPLGPAIGLVDSMRIGEDVHWQWPPTREACLNIVMREWQHRQWWVNDPDCVMLRPVGDVMEMNREEQLFLATVAAMSGGSLLLSDDMTRLPAERWEWLGKLLPHYGQPVQVLGWLAEKPDWLELNLRAAWGHWRVIGLLNWDDHPRPLNLEFEVLAMALRPVERATACHVFDFWNNQYSRVGPGFQLRLLTPPHGAHLLMVRPVLQVPSFVASTRHWTQGQADLADVTWDAEALALRLELLPTGNRYGDLIFHVPQPFRVEQVLSGGGVAVVEWAPAPMDMARVTVDVRERGLLVVQCARREG